MLTEANFRSYQSFAVDFAHDHPKAGIFIRMGGGKTGALYKVIADMVSEFEVPKTLVISTLSNTQATWPSEKDEWEFSQHLKVNTLRDAPGKLIRKQAIDTYNKNEALIEARWFEKIKTTHDDKLLKEVPAEWRKKCRETGKPQDFLHALKKPWKDKLIAADVMRRKRKWYKQHASDMRSQVDTINVDNLVYFLSAFNDKTWPYGMVIFDESTLFKTHNSKRFRAVRKFTGITPRVYLLSGSPMPNSYLELWPQMYLLDGGERLCKNFSDYRNKYFDSDFMGYNYELKGGAKKKIMAKISDLCVFIDPSEHMDLLKPIHNIIKIPLPERIEARYRTMEKDLVLTLENAVEAKQEKHKLLKSGVKKDDPRVEALTETIEVEAANQAVKSSKLRQICQGFIYNDDGVPVRLHDLKIERLKEIVEDANGMPIIVGIDFIEDADHIIRHFPEALRYRSGDNGAIKAWNRGEIPILIMHPKSGGHGISLQHGGNIMVWYTPPWGLEYYQQLNERLGPTRQKQSGYDRPVYYHHIVCEKSLETMVVLPRLEKRKISQEELLQRLKAKY